MIALLIGGIGTLNLYIVSGLRGDLKDLTNMVTTTNTNEAMNNQAIGIIKDDVRMNRQNISKLNDAFTRHIETVKK